MCNGMCMLLLTFAFGLTLWHAVWHAKGRRKSPLLMLVSFCYWHQNCFSLKLTCACWRYPYYLCVTVKSSISKSRTIKPSFFQTLKSTGDNCLMLLCISARRTIFKYFLGLRAQCSFSHRSLFSFRICDLQKSTIFSLLSFRFFLILNIMCLPQIPHYYICFCTYGLSEKASVWHQSLSYNNLSFCINCVIN